MESFKVPYEVCKVESGHHKEHNYGQSTIVQLTESNGKSDL